MLELTFNTKPYIVLQSPFYTFTHIKAEQSHLSVNLVACLWLLQMFLKTTKAR